MYQQRNIPGLGGSDFRATAIGPGGEVTGRADDAGRTTHAFFWDGTTTTDLGFLPIPVLPGTIQIASGTGIGSTTGGILTTVGTSSVVATGIIPGSVSVDQGFFDRGNPPQGLATVGTFVPGIFPVPFLGSSRANAINSKGQIVGTSDITPAGPHQAFLYSLNAPGLVNIGTLVFDPATNAYIGNSEAFGINDSGQIVGVSDTGHFQPDGTPIAHAFLYDIASRTMYDLDTLLAHKFGSSPARGQSVARAINNRGLVVGTSDSVDVGQQTPVRRAFLYDPWVVTQMRDLGTFNVSGGGYYHDLGSSDAFSINDNGDVVGSADTGQVDGSGEPIRHAFRWQYANSVLEDLHNASIINPPAIFAEATGINNADQICGNVSGNGGVSGILLMP